MGWASRPPVNKGGQDVHPTRLDLDNLFKVKVEPQKVKVEPQKVKVEPQKVNVEPQMKFYLPTLSCTLG
ncbi:MAG: hypothetical protein RMX65_018540 [Nostoc sp. DedQUE01]